MEFAASCAKRACMNVVNCPERRVSESTCACFANAAGRFAISSSSKFRERIIEFRRRSGDITRKAKLGFGGERTGLIAETIAWGSKTTFRETFAIAADNASMRSESRFSQTLVVGCSGIASKSQGAQLRGGSRGRQHRSRPQNK
jgi:hypothetical protein